MSADKLAALGAFLSGAGSVLSAFVFVRHMRKRFEQECEKRMQALKEGIRLERER